ncbi:hypothetical protein EYM_07275 [Ignicoccus islandicus DSM 13165]|uniref:DUF5658 domain-containing protein n=1 Tax=Ignicoccus islandicus DSM 13165 TaxID=940295 RepID=A0A0U3DYV3_9CREN|nr:DUF5658 family protein [Ignicoccus islandicus]ALU12762.1 hypothetical protein EYM_07275 [Ignicoccus islandicus DSM 13165]
MISVVNLNRALLLSLIYFLLAISDYYTTRAVLESQKGHEANPIMNIVIENYGFNTVLLLQIFSWLLFTVVFIIYYEQIPMEVFFILLLMKALVVANNSINTWVIAGNGN